MKIRQADQCAGVCVVWVAGGGDKNCGGGKCDAFLGGDQTRIMLNADRW